MKKITTSWVIRTKNEARHIGDVLDVLMKQTRQDFEIIIIDSGSTDKTLKIVRKYPVRLFQIEPREYNPSYALNLGISKAEGQYIGILSGHSLPQSFTFYSDGLKFFSDPKVAAVTGYYIDGTSIFAKPAKFFQRIFSRVEQHYCPWMTNTNSLLRKDLWAKYPFDERLVKGCEDYDWALEMINRRYDVIKTPLFSIVYYRVNNKPPYKRMLSVWASITAEISKRVRPSKSHTKLSQKYYAR